MIINHIYYSNVISSKPLRRFNIFDPEWVFLKSIFMLIICNTVKYNIEFKNINYRNNGIR